MGARVTSLISPDELQITSYPAQRQGGQQVGSGPAGVRIEHMPTGLVAICTSDRHSQHKNREIALHMIEAALTHPRFRP